MISITYPLREITRERGPGGPRGTEPPRDGPGEAASQSARHRRRCTGNGGQGRQGGATWHRGHRYGVSPNGTSGTVVMS